MPLTPPFRRALLAIVVLLLLWLSWTGMSGGISEWSQAQTPGQVAQTITQFLYGLFALLSVVATFRGPRWVRSMVVS